MAKVKTLPSQAVIDGFRGVLDFYVHMGQPCVRSWPHKIGSNRSSDVRAQWPAFSYLSRSWNDMTPAVQAAFNSLAGDSGISGRDLAMAAYISGIADSIPWPD